MPFYVIVSVASILLFLPPQASRGSSSSSSSPSSDLAGAFVAGSQAVKNVGGAEAGMRTMLDALLPAAAVLEVNERKRERI